MNRNIFRYFASFLINVNVSSVNKIGSVYVVKVIRETKKIIKFDILVFVADCT